MRKKEFMSDADIENEIQRLLNSEDVRLAKKEQRIILRRRQYCYQLRSLEKRGKQLKEMGCNFENIEEVLFGDPVGEDN